MIYGYSWKLQSWAVTLYMSYALDRVGGFRDISFLIVFFTETAFDFSCCFFISNGNRNSQRVAYPGGEASLKGPEGRIWPDNF